MASLLPSAVNDERMAALEHVFEMRLEALDLTLLLVNLVDHVHVSALPSLAWQFGALGPSWSLADDEGKRALLRRAVARRRRRGTAWAVLDALSAAGYDDVALIENPTLLRDGSIRRDGTFTRQRHWAWLWVVIAGPGNREDVLAIVSEWKRCSTHFRSFWVQTPAELMNRSVYQVSPHPFGQAAGRAVVASSSGAYATASAAAPGSGTASASGASTLHLGIFDQSFDESFE